jgi:hypothetical protein
MSYEDAPPFRIVLADCAIVVAFQNVQEILIPFNKIQYITRDMTTKHVVEQIIEDLALSSKSVQYSLAIVVKDGSEEVMRELSETEIVHSVHRAESSNGSEFYFMFHGPDGWLQSMTRFTKSLVTRPASFYPSQKDTATPTSPQSKRGSVFGWLTGSGAEAAPSKRVTRMLTEEEAALLTGVVKVDSKPIMQGKALQHAFDKLLDDMGMTGHKREEMLLFPDEKKRFLLESNKLLQTTKKPVDKPPPPPSPTHDTVTPTSTEYADDDGTVLDDLSIMDEDDELAKSAVTASGGVTSLFGSWFKGTSGKTEQEFTAMDFADRLSKNATNNKQLLDTIRKLRVVLSTAKLSWIKEFVEDAKGISVFEALLVRFIQKKSQDLEQDVKLECIRCLRVLLNTPPGFSRLLESRGLVGVICNCLYSDNNKLRALVAEVLAAICVLHTDGYNLVLTAFSDFGVLSGEKYRFQYLVDSLKNEDDNEADNIWDYRAAALTMINALIDGPDLVDDRALIREEFVRRGLSDAIRTMQSLDPPDFFTTQVAIYDEAALEDASELRQKIRNVILEESDPAYAISETLKQPTLDAASYQFICSTLKYTHLLAKR